MLSFLYRIRNYCIDRSTIPCQNAHELWNKTLLHPNDKVCVLCINNIIFKHNDLPLLIQFLKPDGTVMTRKETGLCGSQHKNLVDTIKISKEMGLLDFPRYYPKRREKIAPEPKTEK